MARAIWKGSISFGLVNVPVAMYAAIHEEDLHFHMIHKKDSSPIGYQKVCKKEKKPVADDRIGDAYERDDGTMVMLEDRDFEAARAEGYHAITVLDRDGLSGENRASQRRRERSYRFGMGAIEDVARRRFAAAARQPPPTHRPISGQARDDWE